MDIWYEISCLFKMKTTSQYGHRRSFCTNPSTTINACGVMTKTRHAKQQKDVKTSGIDFPTPRLYILTLLGFDTSILIQQNSLKRSNISDSNIAFRINKQNDKRGNASQRAKTINDAGIVTHIEYLINYIITLTDTCMVGLGDTRNFSHDMYRGQISRYSIYRDTTFQQTGNNNYWAITGLSSHWLQSVTTH